MATRNLTNRFDMFRQLGKQQREIIRSSTIREDVEMRRVVRSPSRDSLLRPTYPEDSVTISVSPAPPTLPPGWVDLVDSIELDMRTARDFLLKLEQLHSNRLKVTFDKDDVDQEHEVDALTQKITGLLRKAESNLKRIATVDNEDGMVLPQAERVVRMNVMRKLGTDLQALSSSVRKSQKDYMTRLREREESAPDFLQDPLTLEDALDRGLTGQQELRLKTIERQASDREKEIIHLAQSINEIQQIFRDLSVLVIEQGTVVDRIDYNVEKTLEQVVRGREELVVANDYSKKAKTMKCILALLVVDVFLALILILKHTRL